MQKEINLLPRKNLGVFEEERTILIVRGIALLSVLIVLSCFVGALLLGKNYSLSSLDAQQANVRSRLNTFTGKITKELILVDRAQHIETILRTRSLLTAKIALLQKQLPPDVKLVSLSMTTNTVVISIASPSLSSLKIFLDATTSMTQKKILFKKLTINNVAVDTKTGNYTVNIQGTLL